jgi:hypothetical protein
MVEGRAACPAVPRNHQRATPSTVSAACGWVAAYRRSSKAIGRAGWLEGCRFKGRRSHFPAAALCRSRAGAAHPAVPALSGRMRSNLRRPRLGRKSDWPTKLAQAAAFAARASTPQAGVRLPRCEARAAVGGRAGRAARAGWFPAMRADPGDEVSSRRRPCRRWESGRGRGAAAIASGSCDPCPPNALPS